MVISRKTITGGGLAMAQYNVTIDSDLLHEFLSDSKESGVSKLLKSVLNQILQAQATEQLRAKAYERTDEGLGYRNDTYHHMLTMREGILYCCGCRDTPQAFV